MWTSQIYGHHDKMARTKTHRTSQNTDVTKTQQTLRNNYFLSFSLTFYINCLLYIKAKFKYKTLCRRIIPKRQYVYFKSTAGEKKITFK